VFAGPIIAREILTAPRGVRFYLVRAAYTGIFFVLMWTAWQNTIGWRSVREVGELARFGVILYLMFALLQLTIMLFFAPLASATAVAHEKDRRTFNLLLMTDLSDLEIVLGKLASSLIIIFTALAAGIPVLFLCALLGGISFNQVLNLFAVTAASGISGGATGLVIALWRDRTFQSVALTIMFVIISVVFVEALHLIYPGLQLAGVPIHEALNPYRATLAVLFPASEQLGAGLRTSSLMYIAIRLVFAALLIAFGTWKLRAWNPGRSEPRTDREGLEDEESAEQIIEVAESASASWAAAEPELATAGAGATASFAAATAAGARGSAEATATTAAATLAPPRRVVSASYQPGEVAPTTGLHVPRRTHRRLARPPGPYRESWDNPILWRELMTRGYGTKPFILKLCYLAVFALIVGWYYSNPNLELDPGRPGWALTALAVLSLILINAQGVTALTSERDTGALDLLLVTDLSPPEFIYGKLYGVLYNCKEMILIPIGLALWFCFKGIISLEDTFYAVTGFLLFCHFSAMLGLHAAITYTNSRTAVANSLGTMFFLMIGIGICAGLITLSDQDFGRQLLSFMIFIGAGSVALFGSLGSKNPSQAIALVAILTPFWSFYCVISLIRGEFLAAFLFSSGVYGFALLAMLVPAVSDFDIALGRTNAIQG
jgi:ABC-type transport system involved in multi-copper enzyme maturation permease subunit